jgi:hypothetical protein
VSGYWFATCARRFSECGGAGSCAYGQLSDEQPMAAAVQRRSRVALACFVSHCAGEDALNVARCGGSLEPFRQCRGADRDHRARLEDTSAGDAEAELGGVLPSESARV